MDQNNHLITAAGVLMGLGVAGLIIAQTGGPLSPTGPPAKSMASLQEIYDLVKTQESKIESLQTQLGELNEFLGAPASSEYVMVGNPGNAPDQENGAKGAVSYLYRMGKTEVTNFQYADFLSAVAASDPNGLHSSAMGQNVRGGIKRMGMPGSFVYTVKPFMGDKPANFVNFFSAVRYCNWLHNGKPTGAQGAGTTEDGAYTLTGPTTITIPGTDPINGANGRNAGAKFFIPSVDEWHKAAYHQPVAQGGNADEYWRFPTGLNSWPKVASSDGVGNINNEDASAGIANISLGADWNQLDGNVTSVSSGGSGATNFYGVMGMTGNVSEWTEAISSPTQRLAFGGTWFDTTIWDIRSSSAGQAISLGTAIDRLGFRVASP